MIGKKITNLEPDNISIDGIDGYQFEELVAKIVKRMGYENIVVTPKSNDFGKDIIMERDGEKFLVECKHQHFVGRPILQKLQGAMVDESSKNLNKVVKGMVVTSGVFSKEAIDYNKDQSNRLELIDGKHLRKICKELNIVILNGKVQVINNKSFNHINETEAQKISLNSYSQIYGNSVLKPSVKPEITLLPVCYVRYRVEFQTHTSAGCIDDYDESGELVIDGRNGREIDEEIESFFFKGRINSEEINLKHKSKKVPYEFTENDIEEYAVNHIIKEHTHAVHYRGQNNVSYSKECTPKRRDIDIEEFTPVYLPLWKNDIKIEEQNYKQEFYSKYHDHLFAKDELKICKICEKDKDSYKQMSICPECGRIVCSNHVKIDYLDKKTPSCTIHAQSFKLFLQRKYFASKDNLKTYQSQWKKMGLFKKLYEDKVVFLLILVGFIGLLFLIGKAI